MLFTQLMFDKFVTLKGQMPNGSTPIQSLKKISLWLKKDIFTSKSRTWLSLKESRNVDS